MRRPDTAYLNGTVYTMDSGFTVASAFCTSGDRFLAAGAVSGSLAGSAAAAAGAPAADQPDHRADRRGRKNRDQHNFQWTHVTSVSPPGQRAGISPENLSI